MSIEYNIARQPDDVTCGPTALHSIYRFYNDDISLESVIAGVTMLPEGGTTDAFLGTHALKHNYNATIYTSNLNIFDPSWNGMRPKRIMSLLDKRRNDNVDIWGRPEAYYIGSLIDFIDNGGRIKVMDLHDILLMKLQLNIPIICGVCGTALYNCTRMRYDGKNAIDDDVHGDVVGHFVVAHNVDDTPVRNIRIADPYNYEHPRFGQHYSVSLSWLLRSIYLGISTNEGSLIELTPKKK